MGPVTGRTYRSRRARGLAPWKPQRATAPLLDLVLEVLAEYRKYWPLPIRQLNYVLTGRGRPKSDAAFKVVENMIGRARRAELVPWEAIRDDGFHREEPTSYEGLAELYQAFQAAAADFRLPRQHDQHQYLMLWCEAAGMVPQVGGFVPQWGIPVLSGGGFDSTTAKHELGLWIALSDRQVVIGVIGDYDEDGLANVDGRADDINQFITDYATAYTHPDGRPLLGHVKWEHLAVTAEQVVDLDLPTDPAKDRDPRNRRGIEAVEFTVQAEAIPPEQLRRIVRSWVAGWVDAEAYIALRRRERELRRQGVQAVDDLDLGGGS